MNSRAKGNKEQANKLSQVGQQSQLFREQASITSGDFGMLKNHSRMMKGRKERRLEKLGSGNRDCSLFFLKKVDLLAAGHMSALFCSLGRNLSLILVR